MNDLERAPAAYNLNLNRKREMTTPQNVDENIFLARVAEQAERFEDMVTYLEQVLDVRLVFDQGRVEL